MTKVLVVEDEPLNMELVLENVKALGFTADVAENGEEAIKRTENEIYDLILMDIGLPGMDGVEATRIIKSNPRYKDVPAIAITSYAMKGDRERILAAGFDDYVSKPIEVPDFMKKMKKYEK
jgi:CheY-like chemotaxis protein